MVGRKGYMRTLEVMIALVMTFAFVLYMMPSPGNSAESAASDILISLIDDESFRNAAMNLSSCVKNGGNATMNTVLDNVVSQNLNYAVCPAGTLPDLPRKKVNAESIYLTGNITDFNRGKVIRLYYWD